MKNTLFTAILASALVAFGNAGARDITVYKTGGGPNGYRDIVETHTETGDGLSCYNPGWSACEWVIKPECNIFFIGDVAYSVTDNVIPYVESLIAQNMKQGQYCIPNSTVCVTWNGTDILNYSVTVSVN